MPVADKDLMIDFASAFKMSRPLACKGLRKGPIDVFKGIFKEAMSTKLSFRDQ
jgi:hypothetical protein